MDGAGPLEVIHFPPGCRQGRRRSSVDLCDRFIPRRLRGEEDLARANHLLKTQESDSFESRHSSTGSQSSISSISDASILESPFMCMDDVEYLGRRRGSLPPALGDRILMFGNATPPITSPIKGPQFKVLTCTSPEKSMNLTGFRDSKNYNLDWSSSNKMAVGLGNMAYIWDADTGETQEIGEQLDGTLRRLESGVRSTGDQVAAVAWDPSGETLAVSKERGIIKLIPMETGMETFDEFGMRCNEVTHIAWAPPPEGASVSETFFCGTNCGCINQFDMERVYICNELYRRHGPVSGSSFTSSVVSLKISVDGRYLAFGTLDRYLRILDIRNVSTTDGGATLLHEIRAHEGPVKALDWCPWKPYILATGSSDGVIKVWNILGGVATREVNFQQSVNAVLWCPERRELAVGDGGGEVSLWKYPSLEKTVSLRMHKEPVLVLALSPDNKTLASASEDDDLALWTCFTVRTSAQQLPQQQRRRNSCANIMSPLTLGGSIR